MTDILTKHKYAKLTRFKTKTINHGLTWESRVTAVLSKSVDFDLYYDQYMNVKQKRFEDKLLRLGVVPYQHKMIKQDMSKEEEKVKLDN